MLSQFTAEDYKPRKPWYESLKRPGRYLNTFVFVGQLGFSALILLAAFKRRPSDRQCYTRTFSWSPLSSEIDYNWKTFENIDLFTSSPYFGVKQTGDIEQAWDDLLPDHAITIPSSRLRDLGHLTEDEMSWVSAGPGSSDLIALPEVFVQLGCINFIRQMGFRDENDYSHLPSFRGSADAVWKRAHQCLERFRQNIMCWADTSSMFQEWDHSSPAGTEDRMVFRMDTYHRCRDFDKIKKRTDQNGVDSAKMDNLWWGGFPNPSL